MGPAFVERAGLEPTMGNGAGKEGPAPSLPEILERLERLERRYTRMRA
jgi:hypothetical protein